MATSSTRNSLAHRLARRALAWVALTALTVGFVAAWQYWRLSVRSLDQALLADARALVAAIAEQDGLLQVDVPAETRARLSVDASYYGVYDAEGRALDGDAPPLRAEGTRRPGTRTADGHREAWVAGPRDSVVRVGHPLTSLRGDLGRLAASLVLAGLCALLPAIPLVLWIRRTLAGAFQQFEDTARRLAPGRPARIDLGRVDHELVAVGRRLNDAFDRLEAAIRREQQLTADASHELRTPVATMLAETEWGLASQRTLDEQRASLETCRRQARRLKELIEALLVLARLESGEAPLARESIELAALVDGVIRDLGARAGDREVTVRRAGSARVDGDRLQLARLVTNLVDNAIRHSPRHGVVRVGVATEAEGVRLSVADDGGGIDPEDVSHVFDRFWRGDRARSSRDGGTGLGLAISKAIVEGHGGTIDCISGPEGTTFTVRIPAAG